MKSPKWFSNGVEGLMAVPQKLSGWWGRRSFRPITSISKRIAELKKSKQQKTLRKINYRRGIIIVVTLIIIFLAIPLSNPGTYLYFFLYVGCFIAFTAIIIAVKYGKKPTSRWPRRIGWILLFGALIYGIFKFFPSLGDDLKDLVQKSQPEKKMAYNYRPSFVAEDAWQHETNFADSTFDHFDVVAGEGWWGGFISIPAAWRGRCHFQVLGNDPDTWIAFWLQGRQPAGPYGRNSVSDFPSSLVKFRLQGKGIFRFYRW